MEKRVAKMLIDIDLDKYTRPVNYTKYIFEIAQSARTKYTSRIYKLIASWKAKGDFLISFDEFRTMLGVEDKYKYFRDVKKYILLPVQKELLEKADCWFNCEANDFIVKKGRQVTYLHFKVFSQEYLQKELQLKDYIRYLLRTHYSFSNDDLEEINLIFQTSNNMSSILEKISYTQDVIHKSNAPIANTKNYMMKALKNDFG